MRQYLTVLLAVLLISTACKEKSPTSPGGENPNPTDDVSEDIGSGGGSISLDEITITIPASAFNSSVSLNLSGSNQSSALSEGSLSKSFYLTGLPTDYNQPIQVELSNTNSTTDQAFIALSAETYIKSQNETGNAFILLNANIDNNTVTGSIPAPANNYGKVGYSNEITSETFSLFIQAVSGKEYTSSGNHFKIKYLSSISTQAVQNLGNYLESAYSKFLNMGFSYSARTNWPVDVTIRSMSSEEYGHSVSSMWGDNYGYLEFNSAKMNESEQIKLTAAHEFFHLVQGFYDGRNRFSKAKFAPDHLWIDEAAAVWAEELFSSDANYSSEIREGQIMAPFRGMQSGPNTDAQGYGYGMSALIKYFNQNKVVPIYNKIKTGSHPIEAVTSAHPNSALVWWPDFIKEYVSGNIYNDVSPLTLATDSQTPVFEIASDSDSLKEFQNSCPNLSGIIYNIKLQNSNFDETSQLDLSLTEDSDLTLLVYKYKGSQIEYIDQTYNNLTISDLKSLFDNNYYLLAVIANSDWSYPYTNMKNVDLTVRVKSDESIDFSVFNYCELEFNNIEITRQSTNGNYWNGTGYFDFPPKSVVPDYTQGSFSGNVFTETWNKNQTNPNEVWSGSLQVSVDKESLKATSIAGNCVIEGSGYTITMNISASNVPLTYRVVPSNGKKQLFFNLKGTNVSSYITNLEWTTETDSGSEQIINMTYNENTELDILIYE